MAQQKPKPDQFRTAKDVGKLNWGMLNADEHSQVLGFLGNLEDTAPHDDAILLSLVGHLRRGHIHVLGPASCRPF